MAPIVCAWESPVPPSVRCSQFLVMHGAHCAVNCALCWAALLHGDLNPYALSLRYQSRSRAWLLA